MLNIPISLRVALIVGVVIYLAIIFVLLKRGRLNVQYSIIWMVSAVGLLLFAAFPGIVAFIGDIIHIEMPVNLVYAILFVFVLMLLLSLSTIVTGFSSRITRLIQTQALLEERVRELEAQLADRKEPEKGE